MDTQQNSQTSLPSAKTNAFDLESFKHTYANFNQASLASLPNFYAPAIEFRDPLHHLYGLSALTTYFEHFCSAETTSRFVFTHQIISDTDACLRWQMHYSHPQLQNGKELTLTGCTLLRFDTHITYHEDFYDMGAMIYQHLPVVGWLVKKINQRVSGDLQ